MRENQEGPSAVGRWVAEVRSALGKTRDEFAEMIDSDSGSVVKWENGERQSVRGTILTKILKIAPPALRAKCPVIPEDSDMSDPSETLTPSAGLEGFIGAYKRVLSVDDADVLRSIGPKVERDAVLTLDEWRAIAEAVLRRNLSRDESGNHRR